ncbi:MAG: nuclear transport factor 2 family protein [bacterium]|nr:nuclear transport factor 2 family protein [bacterium]
MSERDLRAVADELAIRQLVACYADAVTHANAEAWIETWAHDGCWTLAGNSSQGREDMLSTWRELMGLFERVIQLPHAGIVEIDATEGDRGTGRWTTIELGRSKTGSPSLTVGTYHDIYRRESAGWKFAERRFDFIYTGAPDLCGSWLG